MRLNDLLRWASALYAAELPELQHSVNLTDDGGAPDMAGPIKHWLGLAGRPKWCKEPRSRAEAVIHAGCARGCVIEPDNFRRAAYRIVDGCYVTPLIRAIEEIGDPTRRLYAKWLIANALQPSEISALFEIPREFEGDVMYRTLEMVRRNFREHPPVDTRPGWVSRSEAQRNAEVAAA